MPHIKNSDKEIYDYDLDRLSNTVSGAPVGHLVYLLYALARRWMLSFPGFIGQAPKFEMRLKALGALNEAQHELRRLHLAAYEDQKILENGEAI